MNRVALLPCPVCKAEAQASCRDTSGAVRRNSVTGRAMFHRARVEAVRDEIGLVPRKPQPPQLRRSP